MHGLNGICHYLRIIEIYHTEHQVQNQYVPTITAKTCHKVNHKHNWTQSCTIPPSYNNHNAIGYVAPHPPQYIPNLRVIVKWNLAAFEENWIQNLIQVNHISKENLFYNSCEQLQHQYYPTIQLLNWEITHNEDKYHHINMY